MNFLVYNIYLWLTYQMLDKVRRKWNHYDNDKLTINEQKNPYVAKLNIKILPPLNIQGTQFISPFDSQKLTSITQTLPIWSNERLRLGLIWKQQLTSTYNLTHFGTNIQYKFDYDWMIKLKTFYANELNSSVEVRKIIKKFTDKPPITLYGNYSYFYESQNDIFQSVGIGAEFNGFSLSLVRRFQLDSNLYSSFQRKIYKDLFMKIEGNIETQQLSNTNLNIGIGYYWSKNISAWLKNYVNLWDSTNKLSVQAEVDLQQHGKFIGSIEFKEKSLVYFGYKCPSFNIVLPILAIDSPIPAVLASIAFVVGYFKKKRTENKKKSQKKKKSLQERGQEMRLIGEKASDIYRKQQMKNGLLLEEVYIGEEEILNRFLGQRNRGIQINRNQQYKQKIYDLTITFRFYVQKGSLAFPKGSKKNLLGYFENQDNDNSIIYIRYKKQGRQKEVKYHSYEPISL